MYPINSPFCRFWGSEFGKHLNKNQNHTLSAKRRVFCHQGYELTWRDVHFTWNPWLFSKDSIPGVQYKSQMESPLWLAWQDPILTAMWCQGVLSALLTSDFLWSLRTGVGSQEGKGLNKQNYEAPSVCTLLEVPNWERSTSRLYIVTLLK